MNVVKNIHLRVFTIYTKTTCVYTKVRLVSVTAWDALLYWKGLSTSSIVKSNSQNYIFV